jgi:hypothetical protein
MYHFRQIVGFLLIVVGLFLFLYASYDLLWRIVLMFFGFFLINQGISFRREGPIQMGFNAWSDRFRF